MRGYMYEITRNPEELFSTSESDFFEGSFVGAECEYIADYSDDEAKEISSSLISDLERLGAQTGRDITTIDWGRIAPWFIVTPALKVNWFKNRYETFMREVQKLSLRDFADPGKAYNLRHLIEDQYGDMTCEGYGSNWMTFDEFIRSAEVGAKYYVGSVMKLK